MRIDNKTARIAALCTAALIALPAMVGAQVYVKSNLLGVGVTDPTAHLHAKSTTAGNKIMLRLQNNGAAFAQYEDTNLGVSWGLQPLGEGSFSITKLGTGGAEFLVKQNGQVQMGPGSAITFNLTPVGNLTIGGTLTENSSRDLKHGFAALDSRDMLARVAGLEVLEWSYNEQQERHIGPMAEDFHAAFGLGTGNKGLAPRDLAGVTLLAVQGLNDLVAEKDLEIEQLRRDLAELRAVVESLGSR